MKILVTGGAGYIGSHTCTELLRNGYEVVVIDNFYNSDKDVIASIRQITGKEFYCYECDLKDQDRVEQVFSEHTFDVVIHFAAYKSVPESVEEPLQYYRNNLLGTLNLLEMMKKYGTNKLVFSSSATVYGMDNTVPYQEEMQVSATNPYGWTKIMIEQILRDYVFAEKKSRVAILRYFNPIGADPSGLIGERPDGIPNNLMPYLCQTAMGKLPYLKVCGTDYPTKDGTGVRDYIHVCDLAYGHIRALEKLEEVNGTVTYNLGTGKGTTVLELLDAFEKASGIKLDQVVCDRRPGDISESYADVSKAEIELNWKAQRTIDDMCRDSWNYTKRTLLMHQ